MRKLMFRLLPGLLALLPLASCQAISEDQALKELRQMKAAEYFTEPNQRDLAEAVAGGDLEKMRRAIEQGASVNTVGREGMTPLFWAMAKQNLEGFRMLLEEGADANVVVDLPESFQEPRAGALEMAAKLEDSGYLKALLQNGGDPNMIVNEEWQTPLLYRAIMHRRLNNVKLLLENGANIDHQDKALKTPLMQATSARMYEIALFLIRAGADPTIEDQWGGGPADIVIQFGDRGIDKRTNDLAAYHEFVTELKKRGLLE